jgi:hypothetical protein
LHGVVTNHSLWGHVPPLEALKKITPQDILAMPLVQALFQICFEGCQMLAGAHYAQLRQSPKRVRVEDVPPALKILPLRWTRSSDGLNLRKILADGVKAGAFLNACPPHAGKHTVKDWRREYIVLQHKRPDFALAVVCMIWEEYRPVSLLTNH